MGTDSAPGGGSDGILSSLGNWATGEAPKPRNPTDNAFILDMNTGTRITFNWMPASFSESKSANYANTQILGRSEPVLGYASSGPRVFSIPLVFAAHNDAFNEVVQTTRAVRSWVYPDYTASGEPQLPPRLVLQVGSWLSSRCVCRSVDIQYHAPWGRSPVSNQEGKLLDLFNVYGINLNDIMPTIPGMNSPIIDILTDSMYPFWASVNLTLQETNADLVNSPPSNRGVLRGKDRFIPKSEGGWINVNTSGSGSSVPLGALSSLPIIGSALSGADSYVEETILNSAIGEILF